MGFFNAYLALYMTVAVLLSLFVGIVWSWGWFREDFRSAFRLALAVYVPGFFLFYTVLYFALLKETS